MEFLSVILVGCIILIVAIRSVIAVSYAFQRYKSIIFEITKN